MNLIGRKINESDWTKKSCEIFNPLLPPVGTQRRNIEIVAGQFVP